MGVVVFTEGSKIQGLGHIVRCIALCESFLNQGIKPYIYINSDVELSNILNGFSYEVINWLKERESIFKKITSSDIVIIDSYLADADFYNTLSGIAKLSVYIDDDKKKKYPKGIIVNSAIYADKLYKEKKDKKNCILLGTKYMPLRKIFIESLKENITKSDSVRRILLTFGGSDIKNLSPQVLSILKNSKYSNIKKILLLGKATPNIDVLKNLIDCNTELLCNPSPDIFVKNMISSDMAISTAGVTLYELAFCQVPTIAIAVTNNQRTGLNEFIKRGFIYKFLNWDGPDLSNNLEDLIDYYINNFSEVKQNAKIGRNIVDGCGGQRIASEIVNTFNGL